MYMELVVKLLLVQESIYTHNKSKAWQPNNVYLKPTDFKDAWYLESSLQYILVTLGLLDILMWNIAAVTYMFLYTDFTYSGRLFTFKQACTKCNYNML